MEDSLPRRSSTASFPCTECSAAFGRLEHLQRHTSTTHSMDKPFTCTFCDGSFSRRDVLIRHLKSCKANPGDGVAFLPIPPRKRGRKRRSCEACSKQKRACSGTQPCLACVHRKQVCSFPASNTAGTAGEKAKSVSVEDEEDSKVIEDEDGHVLEAEAAGSHGLTTNHLYDQVPLPPPGSAVHVTWDPYESLPDASSFPDHILSLTTSGSYSLRFLSNFTADEGLASSFDCGTVAQRMEIMQSIIGSSQYQQSCNREGHLVFQTTSIVNALHHAADRLQRNGSTRTAWSQTDEAACSEFFAIDNIRRMLVSYWAFWYPNNPFIHKATFSIETAQPALLASLTLIGAALSPFENDRRAAPEWYDLLEEWTFSAPEFRDDPLSFGSSDEIGVELEGRLNALQASYYAIVLQTWEGFDEGKRRARRSRYTDIIGAFRSFRTRSVTHMNLDSYLAYPDLHAGWKQFAVKEELIRTLTYVVLLDSAYVIFNNTPPRVALQEGSIALACPDACFQAEDIDTWQYTMQQWAASERGRHQHTISQAVCKIWYEQLVENDWHILQQLSGLNMFTLAHSIHVQLFHLRSHPFPGNQIEYFRQLLDNWLAINDRRTGVPGLPEVDNPDHQNWWKRKGFPEYAFEYWCLADAILNSCVVREATRGTEFDPSGNLTGDTVSQALTKYDESDMSQVHDLVEMFSNFSLGG